MRRERFDPSSGEIYDEELPLSWHSFLDLVLPTGSPVYLLFQKYATISPLIDLEKTIHCLILSFATDLHKITPSKIFDFLYEKEGGTPTGTVITLDERDFLEKRMVEKGQEIEEYKGKLAPYFRTLTLNDDKLLFADLCRVIVDDRHFSKELLEDVGDQTIEDYRDACASFVNVRAALREIVFDLFHEQFFTKWRERDFAAYLATKRKRGEREEEICETLRRISRRR